jgi:hypothetical protein
MVVKQNELLKPSRIAERAQQSGPPLENIAAEAHRMRRYSSEGGCDS